MPKIEKNTSYQNPSVGNHWAYLISIIDMWTQPWSQQYPTPKRVVKLQFELPLETCTFDWVEKPLSIRATYTLSTGERARFRPVFEALYKGKPTEDDYYAIDFERLIWSPCTVTIVENGEYFNVTTVAPLTKGITLPAMYNEPKVLDLDRLDEDKMQKTLAGLWEKMREKIMNSPEYTMHEKGWDLPF